MASDSRNKFDQVRIITNPLSSNKTLDADGMIENILSKKQVFLKKTPNSFPLWLTSGKVPPMYSEVWKAVQCPANPGFCNTPILSQILMSSGVTTQALGYIWNLVNKKYIGILTEEELYLTLGLIAASQNGTVVHNLDILKQVHEPIIPRLDLNVIKHFQTLQRYSQPDTLTTSVPLTGTASLRGANSSQSLSYSSEPNTMYIPPSGGIHTSSVPSLGNNAYQNDANAIQNISSIVQQQTPTGGKTFSWNDGDDDEFTDFQSSTVVTAPPPNVSITLNPIHYLMASSPSEPRQHNYTTTVTQSKNVHTSKGSIKKETVISRKDEEDDDFTEFQSSLDFDVEIKQPNLVQSIKTIIDTKIPQPKLDTQRVIQKTLDENRASILVENVPQKTKLEVLDTMSDERNTTMYTTTIRDYSALKDIHSEAEHSGSLFEQGIGNLSLENEIKPTMSSSHQYNLDIAQKSNDLLFENQVCSALNINHEYSSSLLDKNIHTANCKNSSANVFLVNQSSMPTEDFDDEFTEFKQAVPIQSNTETKVDNSLAKIDHTTKSQNYFEVFDSLTNSPQPKSETVMKLENSSTFSIQESDSTLLSTLSTIDFGCKVSNQPNNENKCFNDKNNLCESDEFHDFIQVPSSNTNNLGVDSFKTNTMHSGQRWQKEAECDDEFTEFEQAPKLTSLGKTANGDFDSVSAGIMDNKTEDGLKNEGTTIERYNENITKESNEDKYSALRVLEFLDEDTEDKYLSDGDTFSLQEDKDRDTSDGDNVSLQLPCVETQEQDNIQTKCYEACVYIIETSLNLFLANQVENSVLNHPKVLHHLKCLTEVYLVGKRLQKSGLVTSASNTKLDSTWNALSDATSFESNQNDYLEIKAEDSGDRCEICFCENNMALVEENDIKYHPQCINLYLNFVESTIPTM